MEILFLLNDNNLHIKIYQEKLRMSKPELSYSTPVKFELETLKKLKESAWANQRSLSGEVRFRVLQTMEPKDSDKNQSE